MPTYVGRRYRSRVLMMNCLWLHFSMDCPLRLAAGCLRMDYQKNNRNYICFHFSSSNKKGQNFVFQTSRAIQEVEGRLQIIPFSLPVGKLFSAALLACAWQKEGGESAAASYRL